MAEHGGCLESAVDAIRRGTDLMIAGKRVVVCGFVLDYDLFGWSGRVPVV